MGLISAQPNRARLKQDSSQGHPPYPSSTTGIYKNTCQADLPLERGGPTLIKDLQQKSQMCPTLPTSLCTPRHTVPRVKSLHPKCSQSNQLRIQKEAPTGSGGW